MRARMDNRDLTLDILICTVSDRLAGVPGMILPERDGVRYNALGTEVR